MSQKKDKVVYKGQDLILSMRQHAETGIELFIQYVSDFVLKALDGKQDKSLNGQPICLLHPKDKPAFMEWTEFVLRSNYLPYLNAFTLEGNESYAGEMLQYLHLFKGWFIVTVTFVRKSNLVYIKFNHLETGHRSLLRQTMTLKQIESLRRSTFKSGFWTIDCFEKKVFLSSDMAGILKMGELPRVLPLRAFLDTVHPDDLNHVIATLDKITESKTVINSKHLFADGSTKYLSSFVSPLYDKKGNLARIFGLSDNVTTFRQSQNKLEAAEQQLANFTEQTGDIFLVLNAKAEYVYVSANTAKITGICAGKIIGKKAGSLFPHNEKVQQISKSIKRVLKTNVPATAEWPLQDTAGNIKRYRFHFYTSLSDDGQEIVAVGIGRDVEQEMRAKEHVKFLQTRDYLTNLSNRSAFWAQLNDMKETATDPFCLVILDVNGLRMVNSAFGQQKGDEVLKDVSGALKASFKEDSFFARINGGEFAVIVQDTDQIQIEAACESVSQFCFGTNQRMLPISVSFGIACSNESRSNLQTLYYLAEDRMHNNKLLKKQSTYSQLIASLKEALRNQNVETDDHMARMEYMVEALGKRLQLSNNDFDKLQLLASMHDIGKLGIPDSILNKAGPLTEEEWQIMRSHSEIGYRIVTQSPGLADIASEILHHHERWDGTGYPHALKGAEIPVLSQIIAVVDAYDVITHKRVYKQAADHTVAIAELKRCRGSQFAPAIVDLFLDIFSNLSEEDQKRLSQSE